jgi:hypothetical protein
LSSAILYVAIVAIWAGVLIPRWLRRDSGERASDEAGPEQQVQAAGDEPVPVPSGRDLDAPGARGADSPRGRGAGRADTAQARPGAAEERSGAAVGRPGAVEARWRAGGARPGAAEARREDVAARPADGHEQDGRRGHRDQERARVLTARRRLLMLLLVLTAGSFGLAFTRLAAGWVMLPPTAMLLGYLGVLRAAAKVDAERREQARSRRAGATAAPLAPAAPRVPVRPPAPDAEVIHISASLGEPDEQPYDQYADAKLRAVGD